MGFIDLFQQYLDRHNLTSPVPVSTMWDSGQVPPSLRPVLYRFFTSGPYFDLAPTRKLQQQLDQLASNPRGFGTFSVPTLWLDTATTDRDRRYLQARSQLGGVTMLPGRHYLPLLQEYQLEQLADRLLSHPRDYEGTPLRLLSEDYDLDSYRYHYLF
jgi:hypothetical protein